MLEHGATLPTRNGIARVMYRGRYGAEAALYTAPQPDPRARPKVLDRATRRDSGRGENCVFDTCDCEPPVTGKSVRRVYRLIDLISSSSIDDIK